MMPFKGAYCQRVQVTSRYHAVPGSQIVRTGVAKNKVRLDLEKGAVVEKEEKSILPLQLSLSALLSLSLCQAISRKS